MRYFFNKYYFFPIILSVLLYSLQEIKGEESVDASYREKIELQVGRNLFITGETLWYKAFAFSNLKNIYSKVLYVELIDNESRHIMGQIVEIIGGTASASITIPDTLTSGSYCLKAYTNWMRNFKPDHFATYPIYIFNQYDEIEKKSMSDYFLTLEPDIYIENDGLINEANTRVKVEFRGWMSDTGRGSLIETESGAVKAEFLINQSGKGFFTFIPVAGERYRIEIQPKNSRNIFFELPAVTTTRSAINIYNREKGKLYMLPVNLPVTTANYKLVIRAGGKAIWEKSFVGNTTDTFKIDVDQIQNSLLQIDILDKADHSITNKQVYFKQKSSGNQLFGQNISKRTTTEFQIESLMDNANEYSDYSVGIYKTVFPEIQPELSVSTSSFEDCYVSEEAGADFKVLMSLYNGLSDEADPQQTHSEDLLFPVEDIGVLYSGRVMNSINEGALAGLDVILSVKDTIPRLLYSKTDAQGRFYYLIIDSGEKHALINLYLLGAQLSGSFKIVLDNKFYYQKNLQLVSEIMLEKEQHIVEYLDNEAQRVLIQRAFGREEGIFDSSKVSSSLNKPFYGNPTNIVYPSEFFDLPNFEEIAREILPGVRFKRTKNGCEVSIYDVEYGLKTTAPIVLLDGLPVKDYCDLYPLKSEDINRIEIISGANVSGNLFYEGVLAVYSSSSYRKENAKVNGRLFYDVSGYQVSQDFKDPDYSKMGNNNSKEADFKNQLFWDPDIELNETTDSVIFQTSDEEASYTIDICGYNFNGELLRVKKVFNVQSEE